MAMNKLKEALIQFANSNPNLFPNPNSYPTLIEQQFSKFFPDHHTTPNHPPYAAMIHRAIWELKEKGGSSEESISKFIKQEYVDLPWAHSTLLKHHLEKLCDRKEICMSHKQCYFIAGTDFDPISPSTSEKQSKRKKNSESGKSSSGARKKRETRKDSKSKEQIVVVCQEQDQVVQPLNQVTDEEENQEAQILKIEDQLYERENSSIDEVCANATNENPSEDILVTEGDEFVACDENQSAEQLDEEQIKTCGTKKWKMTQNAVSKQRRSKRIKNNDENQQDDEVIGGESNDVKQIVEIKMNDMPVQEEEEELHPDGSGYINIEPIQTKKNPVLLQIEDCPNSDPGLPKSGMRRWTRSQIKKKLEKDEQKDQLDIVEYLSQDEQHAIETIEWKEETKQTPTVTSTQMSGQRAKLRSSQKKTDHLESIEMPTVELLNPECTELSSELCDVDEPIQVQEPEDKPEEDKRKYGGRGRPPKRGLNSAKECKVERRGRKRKLVQGEVSGKSKTANKKDQPKHKRYVGMHKMARRSDAKKRNRGR
ncbi:uncharacterized protein [Rutidosis leptorrhynchoides]|uniref:uncharacterized protein n=1 Tax=Rutidosis leptorrhynchoides TaxID=125765 RepID=UPI003A98D177